MANFRIVITKIEENSNFAAEVEKFEKNNRYNNNYSRMDEIGPMQKISTDVLVTEISEEQFKKIQLEVLKAFE